ncbi:DnaJ domain-containing protein [Candidatus Magnetomoraceae bacterium gMMP-15]
MLTHYISLGLSLDATDDEIRNNYLMLVRKYTPEKDPVRFRQINDAYETIKKERNRIQAKIFGDFNNYNYENALFDLVRAKELKRRRVGLQELIQASKK